MELAHRSLQRSLSSSSQGPALSVSGSLYRKGSVQRFGVAPSVYGGAGGHNTRISTSRQVVGYGGDLFAGSEKTAMQNLNDRLASYLDRVRSLEQSNSQLELQIKQWYDVNAPAATRDYSAYYKQIEELQNQLRDAQHQNARYILQIDNARLAMDDFRMKYENERGLRLTVEADVQGLTKVFDDLTLKKTDLEIQVEELNKDLALLKKEHQEEVATLRRALGSTVSVEVDAAPSLNLSAVMNEMRQKYEIMAQENIQKAKEQFEFQIEALQQEVTVGTEELKISESQIKELRHTYQNLEIELRSHLSMKEALERTLEDTKARYGAQLAAMQTRLSLLENQLMQVRSDTEHQISEYHILLDIKTRLEHEIATYRHLLEGEDVTNTEFQLSTLEEKDVRKTRKIKTVVEEVVDGKVVSSEVKEMEENI
ncbi:keratin, type I cytoskeletal 20 isoform X1 [Erinaceus europaeus]|uniref:Keratin, type I cytoskeletal 20 n=1 Tax=Erinaceus europaeus TaxID=9365 RepID=A0A1S3A8V9_ERIEU|nr:keratin, type I cytoskeletal 20 isoform X1 [Erinaceus europaeus]